MTLWSVVDNQDAMTVPVRRRLTCSIEVSRTVVTAAPLRRGVVPAPIYPFHANDRRSARRSLRLAAESFDPARSTLRILTGLPGDIFYPS